MPGQVIAMRRSSEPRPAYSDLVAALDSVGAARDWFAEGAIEGTPLVVLAGPEKKAKSWALGQGAVATVMGGSWLGAFPLRRRGGVVVIENEYGAHEYTRRLARICRAEGADPREVLKHVRHHAGDVVLGVTDEDSELRRIAHDIERDHPAAIFIDPFRNYLGGGDENSAKDVVEAMRLACVLRDAGKCPVVMAHHLNRQGTMSGSRALKTRADLFIEGTDEDEPRYSTIGRTLRRDDRVRKPFVIVTEHQDDEDDTIAKTFVRARFDGEQTERGALSRSALRVLDALKAAPDPMAGRALRRVTGIANGSVMKGALEELRGAGLAERRGKLWMIATSHFLTSLIPPSTREDADGQLF